MKLRKFNPSLLNLIGNTPLVELSHLSGFCDFYDERKTCVFAKLEMFNFGGSIKDRPAFQMIKQAEKEKKLVSSECTIVEPTSGNTGIGLAWIGRLRGYKVTLVLPDTASKERQDILRSYGAEIILTPGDLGTDGAIDKAKEIIDQKEHHVFLDQFNNEENVRAHYLNTGPEIWNQMNENIDIFVAGIGSGGTITGIGKFLKEKNPNIQIIGIEPDKDSNISGLKNLGKAKEIPRIYKKDVVDQTIFVGYKESLEMTRRLAREGSLLVGLSSGAVLHGVEKFLEKNSELKSLKIATIFPDGGYKYLSSGIFS